MSSLINGVALYTINVGTTGKFVTLVDGTPRQFITLRDDTPKGHEQRIWEVNYNPKTERLVMKNPATGNYAAANDMTHYLVGDKMPQLFKLVVMRHDESGDWVAIQEEDSDRVWTAFDRTEGSKVQTRITNPKTSSANWWWFNLLPGVESEAGQTSLARGKVV
ncbi:hypothetical protein DEU56DRAFT_782186 [Suillus clintonianus]|uniref:uncharacterized protein n=1 Tax=Suillus clintonianus TaxID=1904413 RepID=UPI001B86B867|nr:uncharacterized protein DEU56DRAFT_782186 [Suillus clintonianus]KAG2148782.1 hypothetical protein DEU56DRAFT_782186 [Suillus clintonianus]